MTEIVPTILTSDFEEFSRKINLLKGVVPRVQIDFIDGKFAENRTLDLGMIRDMGEIGEMKIDLHLMVKEPIDWISRGLEILPDRIIGQVEMMSRPEDFISQVAASGVETGIALDLETPISAISEEIYHSVDLILILAVKAGLGGQEFDKRVLKKIKEVREMVGELGEIGVDGGLDEESIKLSKKAGANIFYIGSSFWQTEDWEKRYNELLRLTEEISK